MITKPFNVLGSCLEFRKAIWARKFIEEFAIKDDENLLLCLAAAISAAETDLARYLIKELGVKPQMMLSVLQKNPLSLAAGRPDDKIFKLLCSLPEVVSECALALTKFSPQLPLHAACLHGDLEKVQLMFKQKKNFPISEMVAATDASKWKTAEFFALTGTGSDNAVRSIMQHIPRSSNVP